MQTPCINMHDLFAVARLFGRLDVLLSSDKDIMTTRDKVKRGAVIRGIHGDRFIEDDGIIDDAAAEAMIAAGVATKMNIEPPVPSAAKLDELRRAVHAADKKPRKAAATVSKTKRSRS